MGPDDITPLLWVVMSPRRSEQTGSVLGRSGDAVPERDATFIDGVTLSMWAWATWWIPLLLFLGIWKHGVRRVPLAYTPMLWSLVFPLGMYALASLRLSLPPILPLSAISRAMVWVAVAASAATSAGLVAASWKSFRDFKQSGAR